MFRNIRIRFLYNKNVILSTLCLNLMVMPIRHNFKIEKFETLWWFTVKSIIYHQVSCHFIRVALLFGQKGRPSASVDKIFKMKSIYNDMPIFRKRRVSSGLAAEEGQGAKSSMHRKQGSDAQFSGQSWIQQGSRGCQCSSNSRIFFIFCITHTTR